MVVEAVGLLAAVLATGSFIPQVVRVHRTRRTRDLSLGMCWMLTLGVALWIVYGLMIRSVPLLVANGATLALAGYLLAMKVRQG
jgi:MtN3 and saliva related transmembrane protein